MNKRLDELMPKIFELYNLGWSYAEISRKFDINVNSIRRRIKSNNELKLGEQHYYKNKYVIELYDFRTNKKIKTFKNATELRVFLGRNTNDFLSQAVIKNLDYIYSKDKVNKYKFKIVDKDTLNNG